MEEVDENNEGREEEMKLGDKLHCVRDDLYETLIDDFVSVITSMSR